MHSRGPNAIDGPSRARERCRAAGGAVLPVVLVLVLVAGALGFNYHRNYEIDKQQEKNRKFASYSTEALEMMAEGYRQELAAAEAGQGTTRVATRERHRFGDQVKEFERVQQATRRIRNNAIEVAQMKSELEDLEAEQLLRARTGSEAMVHVMRLFRI